MKVMAIISKRARPAFQSHFPRPGKDADALILPIYQFSNTPLSRDD